MAPRGKKRNTAAVVDAAADDAAKPAPKRTRAVARKESQTGVLVLSAASPPRKPTPAKRGRATAKTDDVAPRKQAVTATPAPIPAINTKPKQKKSQEAPIDLACPARLTHKVYSDDDTIYDATLNQVNIGNNSNKFYYLQLLQANGADFKVWTHWGRVGEFGQTALLNSDSLDAALVLFRKKFRDKTGLTWDNRHDTPKPKKYTLIEREYADPESDDEPEVGEKPAAAPVPVKESKLPKKVQSLMSFIFDAKNMSQTMAALQFNANKLPLGKLSKRTMEAGYLALKELGELIADPKLVDTKYGGRKFDEICTDLTTRYYTVIPHDFRRDRPPVINNDVLLMRETTLLQALGEMRISNAILEGSKAVAEDGVNPLDRQFEALGLDEMTVLDHDSAEFKGLKEYFRQSFATANTQAIEDIFLISRRGESQRFTENNFCGDTIATRKTRDNRKLLWHGSRSSNFGGILSQGLRIAPPEAPVNGYAFGKGIYLADQAIMSWGYTNPFQSGGTGLLLLCEAQLGDPVYDVLNCDFNAGDKARAKGCLSSRYHVTGQSWPWKDAGEITEALKGIKVPVEDGVQQGFERNEYIMYNEAQVRMRYLFRVSTNHGGFW